MVLTVISWLWSQPKTIYRYTADDVNVWAAMVSRNLTIPHKLACVTDMPGGLDSSLEVIPLPSGLEGLKASRWSSSQGLPQCFRRLDMWRSDAAETYGERFVCMDLDCVITASLNPLFERDDDVVMMQGKAGKAAYNGSMLLLRAGSRPQVYERISESEVETASARYLGSDQAFIEHVLGPDEAVWTENDGVYRYSLHRFPAPVKNRRNLAFARSAFPNQEADPQPPKNLRVLFFPGTVKPRELVGSYPFIERNYVV